MPIRTQVLGVILVTLATLVGGPGDVLAQGHGHRMGAGGDMGHQRSALQALEPQMQQLGGLMQQMAERIKAGPLTPDQALHLSGMMEQMATIMTKMSAGILGADTSAQLESMQGRLTAMQPQATLKTGPSSSPETVPQPQKP
jgi:hypothetical protein